MNQIVMAKRLEKFSSILWTIILFRLKKMLTAEKLFDGQNGHQARSAGTESNARIKLTPGLVGWADIIFCMEKKHVRRLKEKYSDNTTNAADS